MSYYAEPDSHIRDIVKVSLDLSNNATKKELEHATGVDASNLAAKKNFNAFKAQVKKLDINELVNVPTGLNDFKKVDDLDVGKLKTVLTELKKLTDAVSKEVVKRQIQQTNHESK